MSLRANAIVEHASLADGGSVAVWVGVPEDAYVAASERTSVDLQLREGDTVLATVTTVLDPSQESEARRLARDVRAAIEAERIPLTAAALAPFADRAG